MNESDKKKETSSSSRDGDEYEVEEAVEELAGLFGAGPKAAPAPDEPIEGEQYAP